MLGRVIENLNWWGASEKAVLLNFELGGELTQVYLEVFLLLKDGARQHYDIVIYLSYLCGLW